MATKLDNWDDDADLQGDLFSNSVSTTHTSGSSRLSVHSESVGGDEDWQVLLKPNDETSTRNAITSAKQAGIPLPDNIPQSALVGGSIKKLSKKKSVPKVTDDWGDDLEFPVEGLKLKRKDAKTDLKTPMTPQTEQDDDFDEWAEGSLGIRFAGTRRDGKARSSSASAMSPSMGSCMTVESEEDGLDGLILPNGPLDFEAALKKRKADESESVINETPASPVKQRLDDSQKPAVKRAKSRENQDNDDFFADFDMGEGESIDTKKLTLHRNVKKKEPAMDHSNARTHATTLTFTDKTTTSRIPRPLSISKSRTLEPVLEPGAVNVTRSRRAEPTTTSAQLLRSKRSMPVLSRPKSSQQLSHAKPFVPAGASHSQSHHVASKSSNYPSAYPSAYHLRRDSDPHRPTSPASRPYSRLSTVQAPDTPSRTSRKDVAPAALAREAAAKRPMTQPKRRRNFGDGSELDLFDDLPTSATRESKYVKQPAVRQTNSNRSLRQQLASGASVSASHLPLRPESRMGTPLPLTPRTPSLSRLNDTSTPRFARDTAASRNAREQRLATVNPVHGDIRPKPRGEGPLMPVPTNWKAQVAARSPHTSPQAQRLKRKPERLPQLIKPMGLHVTKTEKGMTYNPQTLRWEGNENALSPFFETATNPLPTPVHAHMQHLAYNPSMHLPPTGRPVSLPPQPPPSPPRPALIAPLSNAAQGVQIVSGMVFDPRRMCWLKMGKEDAASAAGAETDDDDDPFKGIDDLGDDGHAGAGGAKGMGGANAAGKPAADEVHEEFDLGPEFIRRQREEESIWRNRVEGWFGERRDELADGDSWRWGIRDIAAQLG